MQTKPPDPEPASSWHSRFCLSSLPPWRCNQSIDSRVSLYDVFMLVRPQSNSLEVLKIKYSKQLINIYYGKIGQDTQYHDICVINNMGIQFCLIYVVIIIQSFGNRGFGQQQQNILRTATNFSASWGFAFYVFLLHFFKVWWFE